MACFFILKLLLIGRLQMRVNKGSPVRAGDGARSGDS